MIDEMLPCPTEVVRLERCLLKNVDAHHLRQKVTPGCRPERAIHLSSIQLLGSAGVGKMRKRHRISIAQAKGSREDLGVRSSTLSGRRAVFIRVALFRSGIQ